MMTRYMRRHAWGLAAIVVLVGWSEQAAAAVHDLAAEFDHTLATNPDGNWAYGYVSSNSSAVSNDQFIITGANNGFVAYDSTGNAGGGGGTGWTTGFGFPFTGVWRVPPTEGSVATYEQGLTDWPTAEGDDPNYPNGVIGGHPPTTSFLTGWYAIQYTADTSGPHDIEVKSWQTGVYPVIPPDPLFGGNVRPHQMMIAKGSGAGQTILLRSPQVSRHGWVNESGMPTHTTDMAGTPGDARTFPTEQDEINAAVRSSLRPNLYRITNLNLNAGESVVISLGAYFGDNQVGFNGLNAVVRTDADRVAPTSWDLSDDWSVHGTTASGIGPDGAWSYGILKNGAFSAYDRPKSGRGEDAGTPEREAHGWGTSAPGWFVAGTADPETGPITPGMVKEYSGYNFTKPSSGGIVNDINGDWNSDKVAIHTPSSAVDAARTSVIRWTAPRAMSVDVNGGLWRLTLPDATDRRHQFEVRRNGVVLTSGTVNELGFAPTDTNSFNPAAFSLSNLAVVQGDQLELWISPASGGGGSVTADFDDSGTVDGTDLAQWKTDFGVNANADADADGDSDGNDFLLWQRQLGSTAGPSATEGFIGVDFTVQQSGMAAAVPEPATAALLIYGFTLLLAKSTRKNQAKLAIVEP